MQLPDMAFTTLLWDDIPAVEYPGETGTSHWRSHEMGGLRVRVVEYGPNYLADHWCDRGHVLHVLAGELIIELADGRNIQIGEGEGFCVADFGDAAHRVRTDHRCQVFIVD